MVLKQLRLSRHLSQEQLADMAGLNVRTIQRIESGQNASLESQKCIAAALDVTLETLKQEDMVVDKASKNWQALPLWLKIWFIFNTLKIQPSRQLVQRVERFLHGFGVLFCLFGLVSEPALVGGLCLLLNGYIFTLIKWQGDKYAIW